MSGKKCGNTRWFVVITILFIYVHEGVSIKWLALGKISDSQIWTRKLCTNAKSSGFLEKKQARACRSTPDIMPSLVQAAGDTTKLCQTAFKNRRWNCSSIELAPNYTPELLSGTREQAFVYAMSAAAAVWRLARGCALGNLASCSCAPPPKRDPPSPSALTSSRSFTTKSASFDLITARNSFKWGGCGDDVKSASRIAKTFLQDSSPTGTGQTGKFLHAINMHNNRAGRRAVEQSLTLECKCHGISGSCSVKTCWRGLDSKGPVAAVGRLFNKYSNAGEVRAKSARLLSHYHHDNLLFTTKSPDYCLPDEKRGSLGTVGRKCNGNSRSKSAYEGCEYLCCGRGHITKTKEVFERCECKYNSYNVKCKLCRNIIHNYECN